VLEATSYGLIALGGVVLVAAFCFVCVEENAALQVNRPCLFDESKMNPPRGAGTAAVSRSRAESADREELTGFALSIPKTSPSQGRPSGPDGNSPPRERGPVGVSHG
jgi:hypothetical protein